MSEATIEVRGLRKRFGHTIALDGLSFTVAPGTVTGFVGPNGAGKSTTMRVILGLDAVDQGTALIGGRPYASLTHPMRHVGSLLDASALQPSRSGRNHLLWLAHSQRLPVTRIDQVTELVGLGRAVRRKAGGYSLGMRQRLGIAAAMLGDPPILIMDEPFNGMDPEGIIWLRGFLRGLAAEGRAVLVSSHLLSELPDVADHVVVIGRGRVLADGTIQELTAGASSLEDAYLRLTAGAVEYRSGAEGADRP
jgi:ABC-2 type transport system ATP-binding protein